MPAASAGGKSHGAAAFGTCGTGCVACTGLGGGADVIRERAGEGDGERVGHGDWSLAQIDRVVIPGLSEAENPEPRGKRTVSRPWIPDRAPRVRNDEKECVSLFPRASAAARTSSASGPVREMVSVSAGIIRMISHCSAVH